MKDLNTVNTTPVKDLLGRSLRDLRISVTDRCNFRCPYCMPAEIYGERYKFLPRNEILSFEEIARLVKIFVRIGTKKIRLTGGEPLVRSGVETLIDMLSDLEGIEDITLTTNGYLLEEKALALKKAGLQRITVSLDSLDDHIFGIMNGKGYEVERILKGIDRAIEVGLDPIKVNVVVQKGVNDRTLLDMLRHFKGSGVIVRFIEYMDVGNINGWKMEEVLPSRDLLEKISSQMPLEPVNKNYIGEVADRYRYIDGGGEVGFISSVTETFCQDCTRARMSTDGKLFTCLFAGEGFDLRDSVRNCSTDEEIQDLIIGVWRKRKDRYSEIRSYMRDKAEKKIEMYQIGG